MTYFRIIQNVRLESLTYVIIANGRLTGCGRRAGHSGQGTGPRRHIPAVAMVMMKTATMIVQPQRKSIKQPLPRPK